MGWAARNATIARSVDDKHAGEGSLFVSGRGAFWNGAAYPLTTLVTGKTYQVSAWIKLPSGATSEVIKITGKRADDTDNATYLEYNTVGSATVSADAWTLIEGTYTPDGVTPFENFIFETNQGAPNETVSFYVDDFVVSGEAAGELAPFTCPKPNTTGLAVNGDVETGVTNWAGRGATIAANTEVKYAGDASLYVSGRMASWQGATFSLSPIVAGATYSVSAWVKFGAEQPTGTIKITGKLQDDSDANTYNEYSQVASATVTSGEWVKLEGQYVPGNGTPFESFIFETDDPSATASFYVDNFSVTITAAPTIDTGNGLAANADFPIGVALAADGNASIFTSVPRQNIVKANFDEIVAENIMKMSYMYTGSAFSFTNADNLITWATDAGMKVHGHALVWHAAYQLPTWANSTNTNFKQDYATHVDTVAEHFAGKVVGWDVVNEALFDAADDSSGLGSANGYRQSVFYQVYEGPSFIDEAFIRARAKDPNAVLYYNDFNTEANGDKTTALVNMVRGLLDRNVPIDGVGFQMHVLNDYPSIANIRASLEKIVNLSPTLKIRISELDVRVNNPYDGNSNNDYKNRDDCVFYCPGLATQKARYKEIVQAYLDIVPPAQRGGITVWGIADPDSWFYSNNGGLPDWPLMFNDSLQAKPAFLGVQEALKGI